MNTIIDKSNFPSQAIKQLVTDAVKLAYQLDWTPRVVRQNKKLDVGSLKSLDYAVPCFELSKVVNESPHKTAQKIAYSVNVKGLVRVEAINGFVNFELSPDYFVSSLNLAKQWFEKPYRIDNEDWHSKFIVMSPNIVSRAPRQEVTAVAYKYVDRLYALLGLHTSAQFLLSDYSIETVDYLSLHTRPKIKRGFTDGRVIHNFELLDNEVSSAALEKLQKRLNTFQIPRHGEAYMEFCPMIESRLAPKVHTFLDNLTQNSPKGIIADSLNKAVYMTSNDKDLPLRSSGGLLSRSAYVFYLVDLAIKSTSKDTSIVLFIPQVFHLFINAWVGQAYRGMSGSRLVCFDPYVSKADILDISRSVKSLPYHFKKIAAILERSKNQKDIPEDMRTEILSLVDFTVDLSEFLEKQEFPALFDALNHTHRVVEKIPIF